MAIDNNPYVAPRSLGEPAGRRTIWQKVEDALPDSVWTRVVIGVVIGLLVSPIVVGAFYFLLALAIAQGIDD
jgi:hypothetical protein